MHLNHPEPPWWGFPAPNLPRAMEKLSSTKLVPAAHTPSVPHRMVYRDHTYLSSLAEERHRDQASFPMKSRLSIDAF